MISAIILAAGKSKRMGRPKMLLSWGKMTIIEHVVVTFLEAGIEDIVVVTGGAQAQVEKAIEPYPVLKVYNRHYTTGEMLSSLQQGLKALPNRSGATLIGLGDQPQVQKESVRLVCEAYRTGKFAIVVPSFQMRRGHPWLVARPLWNEILALKPPESPRDFLNKYVGKIHYVNVDTPSILADLDTPEDYQKAHP